MTDKSRTYLWIVFFLSVIPGFLISNQESGYYSRLPITEYAAVDSIVLAKFSVVAMLAFLGGAFSCWAGILNEKPKMPLLAAISIVLSLNGYVKYLETWALAINNGYILVQAILSIVTVIFLYAFIWLYLRHKKPAKADAS